MFLCNCKVLQGIEIVPLKGKKKSIKIKQQKRRNKNGTHIIHGIEGGGFIIVGI